MKHTHRRATPGGMLSYIHALFGPLIAGTGDTAVGGWVLEGWGMGLVVGGLEIQITPARSTTTAPRPQAPRFSANRFSAKGPLSLALVLQYRNACAGSRFRCALAGVALGPQCGQDITNWFGFGFGTGGSNRFGGSADPSPAHRTTTPALSALYPNAGVA
jgi:hypothetical protein